MSGWTNFASTWRSPLNARCVVLTLACAPWLTGCGDSRPALNPVVERAQAYGELPGLRGSAHPQLQQAYRDLAATRSAAAPLQVTASRSYQTFEEAYPALIRSGLQREMNELWPDAGTPLSPGGLEQARRIVAAQAASRRRFARAVEGLQLAPQRVPLDRLQVGDAWLDVAQVGCRVEGLAALETLAEGAPSEALPPLTHMLRVSQQLAREPDLHARLTAGNLRADALQVLSAIVNHPAATHAVITQAHQTLSLHTSDWPADERLWSAEREYGLLVYELVRAGKYGDLLPREQRLELERQGLLSATQAAALKHIDDDELFYLRAMELQIAAAQLPYFQRRPAIEQLEAELQIRRESGDFPLIAGSLLLADVAEIHRQLAQDRCRCEAWLVVLAAAQEQSAGAPPTCSLTGQPYELKVTRDEVAIVNLPLASGPTIRIRRPGVVQAQRRAAGFDLR